MEAEERKTAMSHDEMQDYWKTLCSFTGEDIPNEVNQLMAKRRYPRFLYKYRAVNNNNLDALRSNKLFFSKASSYDDPFDTFLHIDVEKIRQEFDSNYRSPEALAALVNGMKETFQNQPGIPQEFNSTSYECRRVKKVICKWNHKPIFVLCTNFAIKNTRRDSVHLSFRKWV